MVYIYSIYWTGLTQPCIRLITLACFHSVYSSLPSSTSVCFASLVASALLSVELPLCIVMARFVWAGPTRSTRPMKNMYQGGKDRVASFNRNLFLSNGGFGGTCPGSASFHNNCGRLLSEILSDVWCQMAALLSVQRHESTKSIPFDELLSVLPFIYIV